MPAGLDIQQERNVRVEKVSRRYFTEEEQTILRYEASIGKNGSRLEELGGTELEQYAAECKKYLRFGQEVDACLAEKLEQTSAVWVGTVPEVLQQNGCGNMDLYITQKHLRNILQASLSQHRAPAVETTAGAFK